MRGTIHQHTSLLTIQKWQETLTAFEKQSTEIKFLPVKKREQRNIRAIVPYFRENIEQEEDPNAFINDARRIQAPQAEIMYGNARDAIDDLSAMDRMLFEAQEFIISEGFNPNIFHMRDEIGFLRATVKKRNAKGQFVPVSFEYPGVGGMDLDAIGPFDPDKDLVNMIDRYNKAEWKDLRRDQHTNEHQENMWQTHAPALLMYLADVIPDQPMETASPILLEPDGQSAQIFVPEDESRSVLLLSGYVNMFIVDEGNIAHNLLKDTTRVVEINGPCHVIFEQIKNAKEDTLLIVGKPIIDNTRIASIEDLHVRAMASPIGYQDSSLFSNSIDPLIDEEEPDEENEFVFNDITENVEYGLNVVPNRLGILPDIKELGINIPQDPVKQEKLYQKETAGTIPIERWRISKKLKHLDDELTLRMDSAYLGRGYVPPMLHWERILDEEPSTSTIAAEHRTKFTETLHCIAKGIDSLVKMEGFRKRIHKMNQADKAMVNLWSSKEHKHVGNMLEVAILRFKQRLENEHVKHIRCNVCGCTFIHSPKYNTYLAAYRYALGHEEEDIRNQIVEAKEKKHTERLKKLQSELDDILIPPKHKIKCWKKHTKFAEQMIAGNLFTVLQDSPLTAVPSKDKNGNLITENILRKKVWHWFERRRKTVPAQIKYRLKCEHCGTTHDRTCSKQERKIATCPTCGLEKRLKTLKFLQVSKTEFHDDSRWWKDRTNVFKDLNATQAQWNTIYKQLWIQQDRMQNCYLMQYSKEKAPLFERKAQWKADRDMAWSALKTAFKNCTTLHDLNNFEKATSEQVIAKYLSEKEKINIRKQGKKVHQAGDIIQRSAIDRITFGDEMKIKIAIGRKRSIITKNRKISSLLQAREIKTFIPNAKCVNADSCNNECLGNDSVEVWCYKCNTPSIGQPVFGATKEDHGFLYIPCSNKKCNGKIAIGADYGPRTIEQTCYYKD